MTETVPAQPVKPPRLAWLDVDRLLAHPRNVRDDLGDLTGLAASIQAQGVIEPLTVIPAEDAGWLIIAGHRRAAAAQAAGVATVPCVIREDLAGEPSDDAAQVVHIGTMLSENLHREGLTVMEEAKAIQTMIDLGAGSISKIAKATGLPRKRVGLAAGVARLDDDTKAAAVKRNLTLEQAAALATYADDPDSVKDMLEQAQYGPGQFQHAVGRAKVRRDKAKKIAALLKEAGEAGRTVVAELRHSGGANRDIGGLKWAKDGEGITEAEHVERCEGSAVFVSGGFGEPRLIEVCTAPGKYGHVERWSSAAPAVPAAAMNEAQKEAATAARREVIGNNKLMDAANPVRREWIRDFLARKTAPKAVLRFAVESIAVNSDCVGSWLGGFSAGPMQDVEGILGLAKPRSMTVAGGATLTNGAQVPDARLPLQLLAHVAGAIEATIARDSWRDGKPEHARWLRFLVDQGYTLSDVEFVLLAKADARAGERRGVVATPSAERAAELNEAAAADLAEGSVEPMAPDAGGEGGSADLPATGGVLVALQEAVVAKGWASGDVAIWMSVEEISLDGIPLEEALASFEEWLARAGGEG